MDAHRFDAFARSLTTPRSRRSLARLLGGLGVGSVLSALVGVPEALAALRNGGYACTENRQCKTGQCVGVAGSKTCNCSQKFPRCKPPANPCKRVSCNVATGRCVTSNKKNGVSCGTGKVCHSGVCTRTCTQNSDECGSGCQCSPTDPGLSTGVCVNDTGTTANCPSTPCPAGQICINNVGIRQCHKPCGAS
jgi:hypothetical protein